MSLSSATGVQGKFFFFFESFARFAGICTYALNPKL